MSTRPVTEPITSVIAFRRSSPQAPEFGFARSQSLTSRLLPGFALALDTVFGSDEITT